MFRSVSARIANDKGQNTLAFIIVICIIFTACYLPFITKAFHIDDPLYLWTAQQIHRNPLNFYDFSVNWYGQQEPMYHVMKNPPLFAYIIVPVTLLFKQTEFVLHLFLLIPALAVIIGTYLLAKEFEANPAIAALTCGLTPGFLISSTSIMCDMTMLAFWTWACLLWIRGLEKNSSLHLAIGSLLIAACCLTKYFGISLIPLLFIYTLSHDLKISRRLLFLLIPISALVAYEWLTFVLYGKGLIMDAMSYASTHQDNQGSMTFLKSITGLSFAGGCFITVFFYSLLWRRMSSAIYAFITLLLIFTVAETRFPDAYYTLIHGGNGLSWFMIIQLFLFIIAGLSILHLAASDFMKHRDANSMLLLFWVFGTFLFAVFVNWSVNGRSLLPMAPALSVLIGRMIRQKQPQTYNSSFRWLLLPIALSLVIAISATWADYRSANDSRTEAFEIGRVHDLFSGNVWFLGHWGFQYYMEKIGGTALDFTSSDIRKGDIIVIPTNNTNVGAYRFPENHDGFKSIRVSKLPPPVWMSTVNRSLGTSFYSDYLGLLPYGVGAKRGNNFYSWIAVKNVSCRNYKCRPLTTRD
jgi:4-amino-4-deoxy-L-arabinose transferase-like glycosyltransferase